MLKPKIVATYGTETYTEEAENICDAFNKAQKYTCAGFSVTAYQEDENTGEIDILFET